MACVNPVSLMLQSCTKQKEGTMNKGVVSAVLAFGMIVAFTTGGSVFGAHPLITDDTGTQGKGKFQLELNGEYGSDKETEAGVTIKETGSEIAATISWGVSEHADIVIGIPYADYMVKEDGTTLASENGLSDVSLEYKYRFFEKDGLSLAVKPGVSLPTGDEEKGLGNGKTSYSAFFITTKEAEPWAFHFNVGYVRNEYKLRADEEANRKDIWHVSLAAQMEAVKDLNLVANIGMERNPDTISDTHPAFVLGGLIYSAGEDLDLDFGVKAGLNDSESDYTVLAGVAVRW
jgi:hypothetical protein